VDTGIAGVGAYSATKSAIESLSRAAAVEWADEGIRVNTVIPLALTPSVQAVFDMNPGLHEHLVSGVPLGRFGDAESDIGPAVAFLAGPDAGFITGTTLSVDGGSVRLR
jgi:NAD(P)-dependent dehydrogenase (short-subunit alcohol dehydrogenase family)